MHQNLLPSKLSPPRPPPFQLPRAQLGERINDAGDVRLIVLRAPAGFGKTTAMLQYAARRQATGAVIRWLNLDTSDNDLGRFLAHFDAAIERVAPCVGTPSAEPGLLELIDRVAASRATFTLFLDDFEVIESLAVLDLIRQLVDHLPSGWQFVIGSRVVPGLGLGRLRARGQLLEVGPGQLRFSLEETAEYLHNRRGLTLSCSELGRLHKVTDGWATAVWLASLALEGHDDPGIFLATFSGSHAAITEYLAEDVLVRLPDAQREFLLRTSVLTELSAPVCDALLGHSSSAALLAELERSNLFLTTLDSPGHYRYHSLFRQFLHAQLTLLDPSAAPVLHRRASQWYEGEARPVPAIEHALRAHDYDCAARLLGVHAQRLLDLGRFRLLARWLDSLPQFPLDTQCKLNVVRAWALIFTHRYADAQALVRRIDETQQLDEAGENEELRAHMLALRPMLLVMTDQAHGLAMGIENHARLDPHYAFQYGLLTNLVAKLYAALGRHEEARALLDQARRSHIEIGSTFSLVMAEALEGTISLRQGRLQDAIARFRLATNNMADDVAGRATGSAPSAMLFAEALYEAGHLDQAGQVLTIYMAQARESGGSGQMVRGYITQSRLAWQRGEPDRAYGVLSELEFIGHRQNIGRLVVSAELERSRLALIQGDAAAAAACLRRAEAPELWSPERAIPVPLHEVETLEMGRLRLRVHGADDGEGSTALDDLLAELPVSIEQLHAQRCQRLALRLSLLLAEALQRAGRPEAARERMAQALSYACTEGIVQPFADEGPVIASLALSRARAVLASGKAPVGAMAGYFERLQLACAGAAGDVETDSHSAAIQPGGCGDALTQREIHVLKLLALGKSNAALAEALFLSQATIRAHLRNISGKLGTSNRTEAVARAREQGLIS
ncbi:LuxR family transcriptional regulator [Burkholderia sp. R-70006]|uniref:LuxR C-terminal-related transcriptional regulator n=1 Tax=Paraburkholderia domus TaxID=2793075 RepID=UPI001913C1A8|nr:LuxR C-terminal-related transcriptional regulator [Paraburkholderia domus]MBK5050526.1 LuxR family transcriptional regulator [Burkholderia sp. R-70006]